MISMDQMFPISSTEKISDDMFIVSPDHQSDDMFVTSSVVHQSDKPFPINSQEYDFSSLRLLRLMPNRRFTGVMKSHITHHPEIEEIRIHIRCSLSAFEELKTERLRFAISRTNHGKYFLFAGVTLYEFEDKLTTIGVCPGFMANGREVGPKGSIITGYMNLGTEVLEIHICHAAENDLYDTILKKFKKR